MAAMGVPDSYREAGLALGATRWQLVYRVLLPEARPGFLAAVLPLVGRSVGELPTNRSLIFENTTAKF